MFTPLLSDPMDVFMTHVDHRQSGLPQITIVAESLNFDGTPVRSIGEARLLGTDNGNAISVSNIGSSGSDGVSVLHGKSIEESEHAF